MNPSAPDWILKFLNLFEKKELVDAFKSEHFFYNELKKNRFYIRCFRNNYSQKINRRFKINRRGISQNKPVPRINLPFFLAK